MSASLVTINKRSTKGVSRLSSSERKNILMGDDIKDVLIGILLGDAFKVRVVGVIALYLLLDINSNMLPAEENLELTLM